MSSAAETGASDDEGGGRPERVSEEDLATATRVAAALADDLETWRSPRCRALRTALRPLLLEAAGRERAGEQRREYELAKAIRREKRISPPTSCRQPSQGQA